MNKKLWLGIATLLFAVQAWGSEVLVNDAWGRATAPSQDSGSIQLSITSNKDAKLVTITSPVAGAVEIHSMTHENGKMIMRAVESLTLPAGKIVDMRKSGNHLMLLNLKHGLNAGDSVPLTLTIEFADKSKEKVSVKAEIKSQTESHDLVMK